MKKRNNLMTAIFMFITMILVAISDDIKGVLIPTFKEDFLINNSSIGYMITIGYIGYISFTYIGGLLCEKIGQKKSILIRARDMYYYFIFIFANIKLYYASNMYVFIKC